MPTTKMTPKNKLFIGILAFMLIVNILVIFDINQFYIRAILGFVFLITIPGLLIMLCFKIRSIGFWEYLVYVVGLSVAFIMFAGLAVNWILPWLRITDKPLSLWPILISFDILLLIFTFIAYKRNKDLKFKIKFPKFSWLDRIFIIIPMFFPFMAVIGAFLLNNHGTNIVTMIMLGGIAVYVLLVVIFREKLNENVFPWAILMIAVSILMVGWMRSWFVSGVDVNLEYSLFHLIEQKGFWSLHHLGNNYDAMLSITILPTILSLFTSISGNLIIKLLFPLIFAFVPLIFYLISKKYFNSTVCFLASFFFMAQYTFITWMATPIRQEIAFLFFGLMLLVLLSKELTLKTKNLLFVIFGFSMIVSHYATSYIALAIFLFAYICVFFYKRYENHKIKGGKIKPEERQEFHLTWILILLLLVFGFLWYSQVTTTANGLIDFMHKSFSNLGNMFSEDVQSQGNSPLDQFNIFFKPIDQNKLLEDYINETELSLNSSPIKEYYSDYEPSHIINSKILLQKIDYNISNKIYLLGEIVKKLMKIFIIIGFFSTIFMNRKKEDINPNYIIILLSCFFLFGFLIILPFISLHYDSLRTYQQFLIILSSQTVLGGLFIFKFLKENYKILIITLFLLFFFLFMSGVVPQVVGGIDGSMRLNNLGLEYNMYYSHQSEILSAENLLNYAGIKNKIYSDNYGKNKIYLSKEFSLQNQVGKDVLPLFISKNSYVYASYSNIQKIAFKSYNGNLLSFNFPTKFLNDNKNLIYNNGGSEIFK